MEECTNLLKQFFIRVRDDHRISATQISLYIALLHEAIDCGSDLLLLRPVTIMQLSKISSRVTYHRCMRSLDDYGYIIYTPSFLPGQSQVKLILPFDQSL